MNLKTRVRIIRHWNRYNKPVVVEFQDDHSTAIIRVANPSPLEIWKKGTYLQGIHKATGKHHCLNLLWNYPEYSGRYLEGLTNRLKAAIRLAYEGSQETIPESMAVFKVYWVANSKRGRLEGEVRLDVDIGGLEVDIRSTLLIAIRRKKEGFIKEVEQCGQWLESVFDSTEKGGITNKG
jgi:hypothetical protein